MILGRVSTSTIRGRPHRELIEYMLDRTCQEESEDKTVQRKPGKEEWSCQTNLSSAPFLKDWGWVQC